ncbi:hypothetical protein, conserved [Leishmania donovani]|nr:hypothetical protein, conserved [Leishmania donovani]CBZ32234.1 hypothetical protein, conserved [Leishmania donovani]
MPHFVHAFFLFTAIAVMGQARRADVMVRNVGTETTNGTLLELSNVICNARCISLPRLFQTPPGPVLPSPPHTYKHRSA